MIHLNSISLQLTDQNISGFPFSLPIIQNFNKMDFKTPVTFFVGENGSGKSTFLEMIACAIDSIVIGSESLRSDKTLKSVQNLSRFLKLSWGKKTRKGFFLRAEDFFGYTKKMSQMRQEIEEEIQAIGIEYKDRSDYAADLARTPHVGQLKALHHHYGEGLEYHSHGEAFLALFQSRFVPSGLFLLDEPEAPLSPMRQLGLISIMKEMVEKEAQFIIATHSPMLMAFPEATLYNFEEDMIKQVAYKDLENVNLMKSFLNDPQAYLHRL
jgi:predicted ATPase